MLLRLPGEPYGARFAPDGALELIRYPSAANSLLVPELDKWQWEEVRYSLPTELVECMHAPNGMLELRRIRLLVHKPGFWFYAFLVICMGILVSYLHERSKRGSVTSALLRVLAAIPLVMIMVLSGQIDRSTLSLSPPKWLWEGIGLALVGGSFFGLVVCGVILSHYRAKRWPVSTPLLAVTTGIALSLVILGVYSLVSFLGTFGWSWADLCYYGGIIIVLPWAGISMMLQALKQHQFSLYGGDPNALRIPSEEFKLTPFLVGGVAAGIYLVLRTMTMRINVADFLLALFIGLGAGIGWAWWQRRQQQRKLLALEKAK